MPAEGTLQPDRALILVVERDPHIKKLERFFLEQAGFGVEFADDGVQGLERARVLQPHIVVTEIMLRGIDGLQAPANVGPFTAVFVNSGLTIDFDEWKDEFPKGHYCFRIGDEHFEEVLRRIRDAGIPYRSQPHGPTDYQVNTSVGGKIVYWDQPDGHVWELLTKSYARAGA